MTLQLEEAAPRLTLECDCGKPATIIALRHLLDICDGGFADTPDGADVRPVCIDCARSLHQAVARDIATRLNWVPDGAQLSCGSCAREITAMHSILEWVLI